MRTIPPSELIINPDGSVFHLHLCPGEVASTIILVGDPSRATMISRRFESIEVHRENREFISYTGKYNGRRLTVVSTGIGCDNIDIVITELDAIFNIDFKTRTEKAEKQRLTLLRLGTSGAVQPDILIGDYVMSAISVGIDGLLNFYDGIESISDVAFEEEFVKQTSWSSRLARPYVIHNDAELVDMFRGFAKEGVTISAGGFYAPQGRVVRLALSDNDYLRRIEEFNYGGTKITNFEMEASAIAGLAAHLGHRALTICGVIAQRVDGGSKADYHTIIEKLVETALQRITK